MPTTGVLQPPDIDPPLSKIPQPTVPLQSVTNATTESQAGRIRSSQLKKTFRSSRSKSREMSHEIKVRKSQSPATTLNSTIQKMRKCSIRSNSKAASSDNWSMHVHKPGMSSSSVSSVSSSKSNRSKKIYKAKKQPGFPFSGKPTSQVSRKQSQFKRFQQQDMDDDEEDEEENQNQQETGPAEILAN